LDRRGANVGLGVTTPLPRLRMECEPGLEVQVDFGKGTWIEVASKRKRPHVFRVAQRLQRSCAEQPERGVWAENTTEYRIGGCLLSGTHRPMTNVIH